jgi:hypothetical protein
MPVPSPLPLDAFEHAIQTDPAVLGVFYYGSLGWGTATKDSDLDIFIWFSADVPAPVDGKLRQLLGTLGTIGWLHLDDGRAYVGPDWITVDVTAKHGDQLGEPWEGFAGGTVIKDTDGRLARLVAASTAEVPAETVETARPIISEAIGDQFFAARQNVRGAVWSATGSISELTMKTYELLGRLRRKRTYGFAMSRTCSRPTSRPCWWRHGHEARPRRRTAAPPGRCGTGQRSSGVRRSGSSASRWTLRWTRRNCSLRSIACTGERSSFTSVADLQARIAYRALHRVLRGLSNPLDHLAHHRQNVAGIVALPHRPLVPIAAGDAVRHGPHVTLLGHRDGELAIVDEPGSLPGPRPVCRLSVLGDTAPVADAQQSTTAGALVIPFTVAVTVPPSR